MSKPVYEVRRDFGEIAVDLELLSEPAREKVEEALKALGMNCQPKEFCCERIRDEFFKIRVPVDNEEVTVIYEVRHLRQQIDLVQIKKSGQLRRVMVWLNELLEFRPTVHRG